MARCARTEVKRSSEGLGQLLQECVHVGRGAGAAAVEIQRISHNELHNRLCKRVFLKIFYYLCTRYSFQWGCEDPERVALCQTDPGAAVIYPNDSVHDLQN